MTNDDKIIKHTSAFNKYCLRQVKEGGKTKTKRRKNQEDSVCKRKATKSVLDERNTKTRVRKFKLRSFK